MAYGPGIVTGYCAHAAFEHDKSPHHAGFASAKIFLKYQYSAVSLSSASRMVGLPQSGQQPSAVVGISFKEEVTAGTDPDIVVLHFHRVPF